ncbi:class I SAM-dependent rRNA methyltransferase [Bacillus sp. 2205SS5-2]|uniref:class I SAM-dependent rRNA methyltransferase n=1 Tax=Bacillus sp. 2205SS5-2 TaxID=3109031 RepID=UPI00300405E7
MHSEMTVKVKSKFVKKYKEGYPLLSQEALTNAQVLKEEGSLLRIVDERNAFIARGYYGKQNKGYGWILTRNEQEEINQAFFEKKMKAAMAHRSKFFKDPETTAFRVFNGEGDGIGGVTIDTYNDYYVISWYSEGIYTFKNDIIQALEKVVSCKGIYQKKRFAVKGQYIEEDDFVRGERASFPLIVKENGVNFATYLNEGAMVGVFLDQRAVRKKIRDTYAGGRKVLNTFSYTGAFSVFAALGGATKTTSVDVANRSRNKTIEQFSVNEVDFEAQDIIVEDVFKYYKYAAKKDLKFDMVILDPPSFARTKKTTFSAAKDYPNLLKESIAITENNGIIVASTNCSTFDMKKFKSFIKQAFSELNGKYDILEEYTLPPDFRTSAQFPEGDYLKVVFIKKISG